MQLNLSTCGCHHYYYHQEYRGERHNDGHRDGFRQRQRRRSDDPDVERQVAGVQRAAESAVLRVQDDGKEGGTGGEDGEGRGRHGKGLFGKVHGGEGLSEEGPECGAG